MTMCIDYFKAIHNAQGTASDLDARIAEEKVRIADELMTSIDLELNATRNGIPQRFVVTPREESFKYTVFAFPDEELYTGDLLEFRGRKWMVIEVPSVSVLHPKGIVWECNHLFKFQNFNSEIIERWGVLDSGNYSTDIEYGTQLSTTNSQYRMYMQLDEETKKIYIDKRFATAVIYDNSGRQILDVYNITDVDGVSNSYGGGHLLTLRARSGAYNPEKDRLDLMICDYIAPDVTETVEPDDAPAPDNTPSALLKCEISGRNTVRAGLGSRSYTVTFFAEDGITASEGITPIWAVSASDKVSYMVDDMTLHLSAGDGAAGEIVTVSVSDENGLYQTATLEVKVVDLV